MHIVIATDIYGMEESVGNLAAALRLQGAEISVISPYEDGAPAPGEDEKEVYAAFAGQCGHERYSEKILALLQEEEWNGAVGFSAGASALWRALAGYRQKSPSHFLGFYPTRIRKYLDRFPAIQATLVFPRFEEAVDVNALIGTIAGNENIRCLKTPYLHGFLNPRSKNYSADGQRDFAGILSSPEIICNPGRCRNMLNGLFRSEKR